MGAFFENTTVFLFGARSHRTTTAVLDMLNPASKTVTKLTRSRATPHTIQLSRKKQHVVIRNHNKTKKQHAHVRNADSQRR